MCGVTTGGREECWWDCEIITYSTLSDQFAKNIECLKDCFAADHCVNKLIEDIEASGTCYAMCEEAGYPTGCVGDPVVPQASEGTCSYDFTDEYDGYDYNYDGDFVDSLDFNGDGDFFDYMDYNEDGDYYDSYDYNGDGDYVDKLDLNDDGDYDDPGEYKEYEDYYEYREYGPYTQNSGTTDGTCSADILFE